MRSIFAKYTLKQYLLLFLGVLFCLTAIIMLFDMVELLRSASKRDNVSFLDVGALTLLKAPQMMHMILPFVILVAGMAFFLKLNKSSELIVMRAVGQSVWNVIVPLAVLVFSIGLFDMMIFSPITSKTARRFERLEERLGMTNSTPFAWSDSGFWWRDNQPDKGTLVIRASRLKQEQKQVILEDVSVFDLDSSDLSEQQIESKEAQLESGHLIMKDAFVIDPMNESSQRVPQLTFDTTLNIDRLLEKFDAPQTMSFWRFPHFIRFLKEAGFSTKQHEMYFYELIALPAFLVAMLLLSALFTFPPCNRQGGVFTRILMCLGGGFLLYFFSRITNVLGLNESLPLFLAAWGPALVCIPVCISCLLHLEDG